MLWEVCAEKIRQYNSHIMMGTRVVKCDYDQNNKLWQIDYQTSEGTIQHIYSKHVISSAPIKELILDYFKPQLSQACLQAASHLKYRDFLIVVLILKDKKQFDDNWIYIHDPAVDVARIQNFKSWSPEMVPDPNMCCYGMEYFCFEGDGLWESSDDNLIKKAKSEIAICGLANENDIVDGYVVRQIKAYPVYDENYKYYVEIIRQELNSRYPTLHLIGRNGMHKYNNQDHAMMTAMLTVKNILSGSNKFNVWNVNQDAEYHESGHAGENSLSSGLRAVPEKIT